MNSRYYDPTIGRFINADTFTSTGQGILGNNMFGYCNNNPVVASDPSGYITVWDFLDVVSACWSWSDFIKSPSWGSFGSAVLDTIGLIPVIPSAGGIRRAANLVDNGIDAAKTIDTASDIAGVGKKGWSVGDDIANLTKAGKEPSWTTVRNRYWKNEAALNPDLYSLDNLNLMKKGRAPLVEFSGKMYSMELHHIVPRRFGGSNEFANLVAVTPWDHATIDPLRIFKP